MRTNTIVSFSCLALALSLSACEPEASSALGSDGETEPGETAVDESSDDSSDPDPGDPNPGDPDPAAPDPATSGDEDPPSPTCDDGVRNGDEDGVDCGGVCPPCEPATPPPPAWSCDASLWDDGSCDCGCGALDIDCEGPAAVFCDVSHCPAFLLVDADDNSLCLPPPADTIFNPSFEELPIPGDPIPGWTLHDDVGGIAMVAIHGPGQTTAPDGTRALWLQSSTTPIGGGAVQIGARFVRSTPFLPPAGSCTVTVAVGDSNEDSQYTDFGLIRARAPSLPHPLDTIATVDISNRGGRAISPPRDGYVDAELEFSTDGTTMYHVEIRVRGNLGTLSYYADDVRIACTAT